MKKIIVIGGIIVLLAAAVLFGAAAAGEEPGSQDDPLVTLSYIKDVFTGEIMAEVNSMLDEEVRQFSNIFEERLSEAEELYGGAAEVEERSTYQLLTLSDGEKLVCSRGTELLLRIGGAVVTAEDIPGLVDTTDGGNLNDGEELEKNHMYMVTIEGHGIRAVGTVKIIVRGEWEIK